MGGNARAVGFDRPDREGWSRQSWRVGPSRWRQRANHLEKLAGWGHDWFVKRWAREKAWIVQSGSNGSDKPVE